MSSAIKKILYEQALNTFYKRQCDLIEQKAKASAEQLAQQMDLEIRDLNIKVDITWKCEIK